MQRFKRISKAEAKRRFVQGKPIWLCPCKMWPEGPFTCACMVLGKDYLQRAKDRQAHAHKWNEQVEEDTGKLAWDLMYNNWAWYNTSWETGYYAHYYVEC